MALLPLEDVIGFLEGDDEIPGAIRWAAHHDLNMNWNVEMLSLHLHLGSNSETVEREPYVLIGTFEDYRALPPSWRFVHPFTLEDIGLPGYPAAGPFPGGSILHPNGVICASWNRLAYSDKGGPHNDWGDASNWQSAAPTNTRATTIPDMLARIRAEVTISPRRLAPLSRIGSNTG